MTRKSEIELTLDALAESESTSTQPEGRGRRHLDQAIAGEVRRLRKLQGLSMAEVADRAGISKAMISRIENAQTSCSILTLSRLAEALDVKLATFFREADTPRDAVHTVAGQGSRYYGRDNKFSRIYEQLGAIPGRVKLLEPTLISLTDPGDPMVTNYYQHRGALFVYVLEGVLVYKHGTVSYTLRAGDSLLMDGDGWHGPQELIRMPVRYLAVAAYADSLAEHLSERAYATRDRESATPSEHEDD